MSFSARMAWVAHRLALGLRMARPGFLAITAVGCLVGMASAQVAGGVDGARALLTLLLALMLHAAANMLNDHADALNFIGYSLAEKGIQLEQAESMIRRALAKRPEDGYIIDSLGWVYYKKGNFKAALEEIRKASILMPEDPTIQEHLGDVYSALSDYARAVQHYEKSVSLEKDPSKKNSVQQKLNKIKEKK